MMKSYLIPMICIFVIYFLMSDNFASAQQPTIFNKPQGVPIKTTTKKYPSQMDDTGIMHRKNPIAISKKGS